MAALHVSGVVLNAVCTDLPVIVFSKEGAVGSLFQFVVKHQEVGQWNPLFRCEGQVGCPQIYIFEPFNYWALVVGRAWWVLFMLRVKSHYK